MESEIKEADLKSKKETSSKVYSLATRWSNAAGERAARLHSRVRQLEKRLSEALGEQAWRESGLGTPADIDALNQKIIYLEQQAIDLRLQLEEQGEDLAAARATNRELMAQLNTTAKHQ